MRRDFLAAASQINSQWRQDEHRRLTLSALEEARRRSPSETVVQVIFDNRLGQSLCLSEAAARTLIEDEDEDTHDPSERSCWWITAIEILGRLETYEGPRPRPHRPPANMDAGVPGPTSIAPGPMSGPPQQIALEEWVGVRWTRNRITLPHGGDTGRLQASQGTPRYDYALIGSGVNAPDDTQRRNLIP